MTNLLEETMSVLKENGKTENDVLFCELMGGWFSFAEFKANANFSYNSGYGGAEVAGIKIVGKDWWLERGEYDGSEWWEFKQKPTKPKAKLNTINLRYSW